MRLSASFRARKSVCGRLTAFFVLAMLASPAAAETPTAPGAQGEPATSAAGWGVSGSAPQTGSSAYTSGKAFSAPNGQQGTTALPAPMDASPPSAPPAQIPKAVEPPASKILIVVDKPMQEMKVFVDKVERYSWAVSTGLRAYDTPSGTYTARSMNEIWYSKQWDDAPMPHAIFFTKKGHAIHGTEETKKLGKPASHGCVRLAPENARTLFALVKETGLENTEVVLNGDIPSPETKVASHGPRKQQIKSHKKTAATLKRRAPGGRSRVASSGLRRQEIKPSKSAYSRFDPREFEKPRRLSRREWVQLYYSGPPQKSLSQRPYESPPSRRRFLRHD